MTPQTAQFLFGIGCLILAAVGLWPAISNHQRIGWIKGAVVVLLIMWGSWAVFVGIIGALTGQVL
jgi:hypothetical protein